MIPDIIRMTCAAVAVVLVPTCVYAMYCRCTWDQRVRFAALGCIGVAVVGGQLDALGQPATWRMPVILIGTALALLGTAVFLARQRRDDQ